MSRNRTLGVESKRRDRRRDLRLDRSPVVRAADWSDPEATLVKLYEGAEGYAIGAGGWYLRDKRIKRRTCQFLRSAMIVLGVGGTLVPLLAAAGAHSIGSAWGYVILAVAAGCAAFDRYFGLSTAWMRDIQGAQAVYRALADFQLGWASLFSSGSLTEEDIDVRLGCLKEFTLRISAIVAQETALLEQRVRGSRRAFNKSDSIEPAAIVDLTSYLILQRAAPSDQE